jgi:small subunit ribosomal protein S33
MGNKILRQRLRGPALAAYYPRKAADVNDLRKMFGDQAVVIDEVEEDRLESILGFV